MNGIGQLSFGFRRTIKLGGRTRSYWCKQRLTSWLEFVGQGKLDFLEGLGNYNGLKPTARLPLGFSFGS